MIKVELRDLFTDDLMRTFTADEGDDLCIRDNTVYYYEEFTVSKVRYAFSIPPGYYAIRLCDDS